jgi:hypothetical protein
MHAARGATVTIYLDYLIDLGMDLAAIFLLAYVLYYRRHRRSDLLLAYVSLNVGLFVAISLLTTVRVDIALGFGLFAILSIIRLRSNTVTQEELRTTSSRSSWAWSTGCAWRTAGWSACSTRCSSRRCW